MIPARISTIDRAGIRLEVLLGRTDLESGIRVFGALGVPPELEISEGSQNADMSDLAHQWRYASDARVPLEHWHHLSPHEIATMICASGDRFEPAESVAFIVPPENVRWYLTNTTSHALGRASKCSAQNIHDLEDTFRNELTSYLSDLGSTLDDMRTLNIATNGPDELTTTYSPSGKRIGMHVDNWEVYPLRRRNEAKNRVGLNLGPEARWLLFVNIPVTTLVNIRLSGLSVGKPSEFASRFFALFPDYPLIRLRVPPGCGYIAPTENMIHDGSTSGSMTGGRIMFVRGNFRPVF